jgi:hypothetical protein
MKDGTSESSYSNRKIAGEKCCIVQNIAEAFCTSQRHLKKMKKTQNG